MKTKVIYRLMSNDAIHVATMKQHGITNIATNDPDFERVEWIKVWKP
ncbi:MAG: PIN domain-containing protein [Methanophagales archaeon]|nr:PIN domain-containing protein [Methanophagales archaeon]